jgi:hypothetical protein
MEEINYKALLKNSINFDLDEKKLINTRLYELAIYPEINTFKIGEKVRIRDCFNNFSEGYIENFNADGTIFIKINFSDMGADYSRNFVSKIK